MRLQVLASGSRGNATLVRAGEVNLLVDAGLSLRELEHRFEAARFSGRNVHHIALSHGHLDHARSSGPLARRTGATLHLCERLMHNRSVERAPRLSTLRIGTRTSLDHPDQGEQADGLFMTAIQIPHDADPTVAFALDHAGRRAVILTDMGEPTIRIAEALKGAHVLVLEFNHDERMLAHGPYPINLKRRVAGKGGHLSNAQAAEVLGQLCTDQLHTLVLAHLSEKNNRPELARVAAENKLAELGRSDVRVLIAEQDTVLEALDV